MPVVGLSGVTGVAAGGEDSFALLSNGTAMAWGDNEYGEHGNGTGGPLEQGSPGEIVTVGGQSPLSGITALATGTYHAVALLNTGRVMAWGRNWSGQLGQGNNTGPELCNSGAGISCSRWPVEVIGLHGVTGISANGSRSLAVLSNGTVMAWGEVPEAVSGLKNVTAVSAGDEHSLALLSNGTVKAWGANGSGQLGNGTTTSSEAPVAVKGLTGVVAISAGHEHSLALLSDGTSKAWGANEEGQLGNGTTTNSDVPVAVSGLSGVSAISAAGDDSLALVSGTVMAWGANGAGQLGDGNTIGSDLPVAVSGLREVAGISDGFPVLAFGPPRPIVSEVSPNFVAAAKAAGTTVTITGTGFTEATAVDFGSTSAASFTVKSPTSITAVSPPGTGAVDVTVTSPAGTSFVSAADQFHYFLMPTIAAAKPKTGLVTGGTKVKIEGTNLSGVTAVTFGSTNATSFTVNSDTSITAFLPATTAAAGSVNLTVTTAEGVTSAPSAFVYRPVVTGVSPATGSTAGGTSVTITGAGFAVGSSTTFQFETSKKQASNCTSNTTCTVVTPAHAAGTVDVKAGVVYRQSNGRPNRAVSPNRPADQFTYN